MTAIPGFCKRCRAVFMNNNAFSFDRCTDVTLEGNSVDCPKCGTMAGLIEGRFDFIDGKIIVKDAPLESILIIAAGIAGQQLRDGRIDEEKLFAPLNNIAPELRDILKKSFQLGGLQKYLAAIFAALVFLIGNNTKATLDWNVLYDQIRTSITHAAPYPNLRRPEEGSERHAEEATTNAPSATPKSGPSLSKRQQRRLRGRTKMHRKRGGKPSSPNNC